MSDCCPQCTIVDEQNYFQPCYSRMSRKWSENWRSGTKREIQNVTTKNLFIYKHEFAIWVLTCNISANI